MANRDKGQAIFQELGDFVREEMQRLTVPGVAVGVIYDGRDFLAGFGVTHIDHPLAVDADTLFQIGSTTKTVTATLAMVLAGQGRLDLDTPVRAYLPKLKLSDADASARVTTRHLLTHTGGWAGDYFEDTGTGDDALAKYVARMARLPQLTPLGEVYSYNNAAFSLAGRVLEVIAGKTYEAAATESVLRPLGMTRSLFFPAEVMLHRFAAGHAVAEGKVKVARPWPIPRANNPAGGVASSARDQLRYARFHINEGVSGDAVPVLPAAEIAEMQARVCDGPLGRQQGLAWMLRDLHGARLVLHGGSTNGQNSAFLMVPAAGFAMTVLTNSSTGGHLHTNVVKWALKRYLALDDADPAAIAAPPAQMATFAGRYEGFMQDLEIAADDEGLSMTHHPRESVARLSEDAPRTVTYRIAPSGPDRYVGTSGLGEGSEGEMLRDGAGDVAWLRFGGRLYRRLPDS